MRLCVGSKLILLLLLSVLSTAPVQAMYESEGLLFDHLYDAGFRRVISFPASSILGLAKRKPLVLTTAPSLGAVNNYSFDSLETQLVHKLSYKGSLAQISGEAYFAFQVGDFLVCYRKGKIRDAEPENLEGRIRGCYIFPKKVSRVVDDLGLIFSIEESLP